MVPFAVKKFTLEHMVPSLYQHVGIASVGGGITARARVNERVETAAVLTRQVLDSHVPSTQIWTVGFRRKLKSEFCLGERRDGRSHHIYASIPRTSSFASYYILSTL